MAYKCPYCNSENVKCMGLVTLEIGSWKCEDCFKGWID